MQADTFTASMKNTSSNPLICKETKSLFIKHKYLIAQALSLPAHTVLYADIKHPFLTKIQEMTIIFCCQL